MADGHGCHLMPMQHTRQRDGSRVPIVTNGQHFHGRPQSIGIGNVRSSSCSFSVGAV